MSQKMFDHLVQPHVQTDSLGTCFTLKIKLERAIDGAPSQIPTLKFLTPSTPKSNPGDRMKILCDMFVRTYTKFGIKIFEIDVVIEI